MKVNMRFFIIFGFIFIFPGLFTFCQVFISNSVSISDPSAMLEVKSSDKGFLPPRIALSETSTAAPVISPAAGLLVYNTAIAGSSPYNVIPGYYYWNGNNWISIAYPQEVSIGDMFYWNGAKWVVVPLGFPGQFLQLSVSNIPAWSGAAYTTLNTTPTTYIENDNVISGGNITSDGGGEVTARGVCWSTSAYPIITGNNTNDGTGVGAFISYVTGLTEGTQYYIRAYAVNSAGTTYGNELTFTTLILPELTTTEVTNITSTTATSGGNIISDRGSSVTSRGACWSTNHHPTVDLTTKTVDGSDIGIFTSSLTGLAANTTYYVRAYAINSVGTGYGNEVSFTTNIAIGDGYQGGKVAYIFQPGDPGYRAGEIHGLIAALVNQGLGAWGCINTVINGADGTVVGTGNQNTIDIMAGCSTAGIAARLCGDLVSAGYNDWYLPSKDELNHLYINRGVLGGFNTDYYWSSSEYDNLYAWCQSFSTGIPYYNSYKNTPRPVRPVRTF